MNTTLATTTLQNWSVDDLLGDLQSDARGRQHGQHFHQLFRRLRHRNQGTSRNDIYEKLRHFDNLHGHWALRNPQGIQHVVHHLRQRKIKNLHQRCKLAKNLHDVPFHLALSASDLRQRCWQAPSGLFFEAEELRLECGGLPDLRRVVLLVPPRPSSDPFEVWCVLSARAIATLIRAYRKYAWRRRCRLRAAAVTVS